MANGQYNMVSLYVHAHEDDYQLFMNPNFFGDLGTPNSKVALILATAGDGGQGPSYWQAREEGTNSSTRFFIAAQGSLSGPGSYGTRNFNGHVINCWSANNATHYFMRLPDGNIDGSGFPLYGNQSIGKLRTGAIPTITAVDQSATYNGWSDFVNTIQAIIQAEASGIQSTPWINYTNPDPSINPGDHSDHVTTGQAAQAMGIISNLNQALFINYHLSSFPEDLTGENSFWKCGMFAAYEKAVYDASGHSTLAEPGASANYIGWCLRSPHYSIIQNT